MNILPCGIYSGDKEKSMSYDKLVSVFLPYYNDSRFLGETIESILNQTYTFFELFLFNHASTDGSRDIARSYDDSRIVHIDAKKNLGAGSGLNLANTLPLMKGKYLKLFCADDTMEPFCLKELVDYLESNPDKDIVYTNTFLLNENDIIYENGIKKTWYSNHDYTNADEKYILKLIFNRKYPPCYPSSFFKMSDIKEIKLDYVLMVFFDVYLLASLLINGKKIGFIHRPLISYRINSGQLTPANILLGLSNETSDFTKLHVQQAIFESLTAINIFYSLKDIDIIKYLTPTDRYSCQLNERDEEFIPFIIAHYLLNIPDYMQEFDSCHFTVICNGFSKMHELMSNNDIRYKIESRFGFGILEFRALYAAKLLDYEMLFSTFAQRLRLTEGRLRLTEEDLKLTIDKLATTEESLRLTKEDLNLTANKLTTTEEKLRDIINSRTYRYAGKITGLIRKILPRGSKRAGAIKAIFKPIKYLFRPGK